METTNGRAVEVGDVMDTFIVRMPRWPVLLRLLGRGPLVRRSDRVEALLVVLALVVAVVALPIAAAVGTAVYDANRHLYAEQAKTRHLVTATVTEIPAHRQVLRNGTVGVQASWLASGEHTGEVKAHSASEIGDTVELWVDDDGAQAQAPTPTTRAALEGFAAALAVWLIVAAAMATLFTITRGVCDRLRWTGWQHDFEHLADSGDGRQHPGRTSDR